MQSLPLSCCHSRASLGPGQAAGLDAVNDDGPHFLAMIGLVALVVALVILIFFGIGYLFGRLFL